MSDGMTPERWRQVTAIFHAAVTRDAPARASYLDEACVDDPALRAEVDAMLAAHDQPSHLGAAPVMTAATPRLESGSAVGPYRIDRLIGAGGMGEVYRARDTKLERDVAVKVLPATFTSDPDRRARFDREARALAALNHPHIAAIYGFEEADGLPALILELVDGDTLADRLARGPVPIDEALVIARQIADALEAAHERGIIHRDLKPANIKITPAGAVKILDFGLAKICATESAASELFHAPMAFTGTREGMILGTAAYMSPEQARGQAVDKRTDIWAFGCVLYEMLSGRTAFPGDTISDTIAAILEREPDWTLLPESIPVKVRDLLQRCVRKDPKRRLHDIADARLDVDDALTAETAPIAAPTTPRPPSRRRRIATFAAVALVASTLAGVTLWQTMRPSPPRVSRFTISPSSSAALTINGVDRDLAITPDGTRIVYAGANGSALFVRALDRLDAMPLTSLGAPRGPFLSPDSQWIGFADGTTALKKVALSGGPAILLGRLDGNPRGATWGPDDTVVFATTNVATGLQQIPAAGGEPTVLTRPNRASGEADHLWPEFLPEGETVLFTITATTGGLDAASIAILDLRTGAQTILIRGGSHAHYVRGGHLVYGATGTLRAVPFDLTNRTVIGPPVPVVPRVVTTPFGAVDAVVAGDGTLAYVPGGSVAATQRTLVWVDRQGREEPVTAPPRAYVYPRLAPGGTHLALYIADEELDVWLWDLARTTLTRVTLNPGLDIYPVWTPDSRRLLFSSEREGRRNLFGQAADGTGTIERLTESPNNHLPSSMSPDGTRLVFTESASGTGDDVMMLVLSGPRQTEPPGRSSTSAPLQDQGVVSTSNHEVRPLIQTPFTERNGEVSPNGRWLAYEANDSGRIEIYVRPFPDVTGGRWQVSTSGGVRPLWARSGQELFYLSPMGALMRVGVERGPTWAATGPAPLFEGRYFTGTGNPGRTYDVSPDGRRFLMIKDGGGGSGQAGAPASLIVVQNWHEELKRLVPAK